MKSAMRLADRRRQTGRVVGLLCGLAAATSGVVPIMPALGVRPWHLFVIAALVVAGLRREQGSLGSFTPRALEFVALGFVAVAVAVEVLNARALHFTPDLISSGTMVFYLCGYLAARLSIQGLGEADAFLRSFVKPALVIVPLAVAQCLRIDPISSASLVIAPSDGASSRVVSGLLARATGLTGHWSGLGGYFLCVLAALICLRVLSARHGTQPANRLVIGGIAAIFIGLVATLTFSVIISGVVLLLVSWRAARFDARLAGLLGIASVLGAVVFGGQLQERVANQSSVGYLSSGALPAWVPNTLQYRWTIWRTETIPAWQLRPFTGWGIDVYSDPSSGRISPLILNWPSAESQWLLLLVTQGLVVTVAFIVLLVWAGFTIWQGDRGLRDARLPFLWLMVLALLTAATFPIFTNRGFPMAFWVLVGVASALGGLRDTTHTGATSPNVTEAAPQLQATS